MKDNNVHKPLTIRYCGMFSSNHSWCQVTQNLTRAFMQLGHNIFVYSSNENKKSQLVIPKDLQGLLTTKPLQHPADIDFTYTLPRNFKLRLKGRCNLGIYNYESSALPEVERKGIHYCDFLLPSSTYCYNIFINAGVDKDKLRVVPHGVDSNLFNPSIPKFDKLYTQKKFKFLCVAIPHARKNFEGLLRAYGMAFRKSDDVCLVFKTRLLKGLLNRHDVNIQSLIKKVRQEMGGSANFPSIEIVDGNIPQMASLYNACDCFVSMTHSEGFGMPFLEALACGKPVIAPNYSGQTDFLNENNALMVDTKVMYAPQNHQYWEFNPKALTGHPDEKHCAELMRKVYTDYNNIITNLHPNMVKTVEEFSWKNAASMMIDLHKEKLFKKAK